MHQQNQFEQFSRWLAGLCYIAWLWIELAGEYVVFYAHRVIQSVKFFILQMALNTWSYCLKRESVRASAIAERIYNALESRWLPDE